MSPFYRDLFAALNHGLWMSIALIVPAACGGVLIGFLAGSARAYGPKWLRKLGDFYAALFRGTPLVVQLFVLYYGLPSLKIYLSPYAAAVIGFMLCSGAYQSEYVRGAFLSIKRGQYQGALALGFGHWQTLFTVILPQALRIVAPPLTSQAITLVKDSALVSTIAVYELTMQGRAIIADTYLSFEIWFLVAALYLAVALALSALSGWVKRRCEPGRGKVSGGRGKTTTGSPDLLRSASLDER